MKSLLISIIIVLLPWAIAHAAVGEGGTTITCIDHDNDGYGVGACTGVDADDNDATVQTTAQMLTKYGSESAMLSHLGYTPLRKWYVATDGNNGTCAVNDATKPCLTGDYIKTYLQAGDMVLYRAGTHTNRLYNSASEIDDVDGTEANPIVFMAYPGEAVTVSHSGPIKFTYSDWITVDGFEFSGPTNLGYAVDFSINTGIVIKNNHMHHYGTIVHNGGYGTNITIDNNVIHNSYGEHCIYLGGHWDTPSMDVFITNNIMYNCATTGFQFNGPVTNLQFDNNIVYSSILSPISLLMGVSDSFFRNNLTFNSDRSAVTFYDYNGNCTEGETQYICPGSQTGNTFENNTFWIGTYTNNWKEVSPYPSTVRVGNQPGVLFSDSSTSAVVPPHYAAPHDFGGNIFRNNIIVTQEATAIQFFWSAWLDSTVIQNNLFYRGDGSTNFVAYGGVQPTSGTITNYTVAQIQSMYPSNISGNVASNPLFTSVNTSWWHTPVNFDFTLTGSSPALNAGIYNLTTDLKNITRLNPPDIGAFELSEAGPKFSRSTAGGRYTLR